MEAKTKLHAAPNQHDILITREFDLPVELLFKAHSDPELLGQWMGTRVVALEPRPFGQWQFETGDPQGNILFKASGVYHDFVHNQRIVRTFQMENGPFETQLEFFEFTALENGRSKLSMHLIFRSVALRDQQLKMPFAYGLNMAHDRLQEIFNTK